MSFEVTTVRPQDPFVLPQPTGGVTVIAGANVGITSPTTTSNPVVITGGTTSSPTTLVIGTQSAQVVLASGVTEIGIALDSSGNRLSMAGAVIQATDTSTGGKIVNLQGANVGGATVDGNINLAANGMGGFGTIADNAPLGTFTTVIGIPANINFPIGAFSAEASLQNNGEQLPSTQALIAAAFPEIAEDILLAGDPPATYVHTGAGNDQIEGTEGADFIRAGAGADIINSGSGNDIIRSGSGSDNISLGAGNDILYYTVDQIQGISTDTLTDFNGAGLGTDLIQIKKDLQSFISIAGIGTSQIVLSYAQGGLSGTTTIVTQAGTIKAADIQFV